MCLSKQALPILEFSFVLDSCSEKKVGGLSFPFKICFFLSGVALILKVKNSCYYSSFSWTAKL